MEIGVLGDDDQIVLRGIAPYGEIVRFDELGIPDVYGSGINIRE